MLWSANSKIYGRQEQPILQISHWVPVWYWRCKSAIDSREKKVILLNEVRHTNASSKIAFVWKVWTTTTKPVISANRRHDERSPKGRMSSEIQKEVPSGDSLAMAWFLI